MNHWSRLTLMLNQMSHSLGQADFCPFALPLAVLAKLQFIHRGVTFGDGPAAPVPPQTQPEPL